MDEAIASLHAHNTWDLEELPSGAVTIPVRWVCKGKRDPSGRIERLKARLVAKGYMQWEGVDYGDVYAPVCKQTIDIAIVDSLPLHVGLGDKAGFQARDPAAGVPLAFAVSAHRDGHGSAGKLLEVSGVVRMERGDLLIHGSAPFGSMLAGESLLEAGGLLEVESGGQVGLGRAIP